jgi:3',5'-cyclic AMP phosphodiesterase CpdA
MPSLPNLRLAVITDLHVGSDTSGSWHNRYLSDDPADTTRAAVATLNAARPDAVLVLGDLAEHGAPQELAAARAALDGLQAPWLACRGNHDRPPGGDDSGFMQALGSHAQVGVVTADTLPMPDGVMALSFAADWAHEDGRWRVAIPEAELRNALDALANTRPALLLALCHFPFVRQSDYVRARDPQGKNAGTLWEGEAALAELAARCDALLCLAGHQHFHHIATGANWLHCTTAALVEYPADYRLITIGPAGVQIETRPAAPEVVAAAPPPRVTWPAGRPQDRECVWRPDLA